MVQRQQKRKLNEVKKMIIGRNEQTKIMEDMVAPKSKYEQQIIHIELNKQQIDVLKVSEITKIQIEGNVKSVGECRIDENGNQIYHVDLVVNNVSVNNNKK